MASGAEHQGDDDGARIVLAAEHVDEHVGNRRRAELDEADRHPPIRQQGLHPLGEFPADGLPLRVAGAVGGDHEWGGHAVGSFASVGIQA